MPIIAAAWYVIAAAWYVIAAALILPKNRKGRISVVFEDYYRTFRGGNIKPLWQPALEASNGSRIYQDSPTLGSPHNRPLQTPIEIIIGNKGPYRFNRPVIGRPAIAYKYMTGIVWVHIPNYLLLPTIQTLVKVRLMPNHYKEANDDPRNTGEGHH